MSKGGISLIETKFTCRIITPMFLAGADKNKPELRAPSLKGAMRFWWRAINSHLSLSALRQKEGEIFGSSEESIGRSKFALSIRTLGEPKIEPRQPLPHHTGGTTCEYLNRPPKCEKDGKCSKINKSMAIVPEQQFECNVKAQRDYSDEVANILKVTSILGGLGKRSRRGFGSFEITHIDGQKNTFDYSLPAICALLNKANEVKDSFIVNAGAIERKEPVHKDAVDYPYIKKIEIGDACVGCEHLLREIGKASHDVQPCEYTGFAGHGNQRFASPVYVSVISETSGYKPIISSLNTAFEKNYQPNKENEAKVVDFISQILSAGTRCK